MKLLAPLLLGLTLAGAACTGIAAEPRDATLFIKDDKGGTCSATTVYLDKRQPRSNIILTAAHCVKDMKVDAIQYREKGIYMVVDVDQLDVVVNDRDQALVRINYFLPNPVGISKQKLRQQDRVRWWGNPQGFVNMYREGYVAAINPDDDGHYLIIPAVSFGDSGAGIFDSNNRLVSVVSQVVYFDTFCATLSKNVVFTPEQIKEVME